uniref:transglutaminase-like cysteine peptidase n=1 Tax=Thaumasiovibrio occultus TaxID=1891184 RepID=UPI000B357BE8|nr:transglutaminase-like cysteine peptidase [Thaumasiovibrio occultus]
MRKCLTITILLSTFFGSADVTRHDIENVRNTYGERAAMRVSSWQDLLAQLKGSDDQIILEQVNQFFNQLYFVDDKFLWGESDYWATPLEFLGASAGDCEDFSIAKYFSLRDLGISDQKLRLVYVKSITLNQFHMVVAYYPTPSSVPLLLDNIDGEIKPASQRDDLLPIYSFNGSKLWLLKEQGTGQEVAGQASRLSLWNDLRARNSSTQFKTPLINYDE